MSPSDEPAGNDAASLFAQLLKSTPEEGLEGAIQAACEEHPELA